MNAAVRRTDQASELLTGFAARTGLTGGRAPQRYLWTDAFAVCTWLGLTEATGEARHAELALRLVDQVHHTLGRHRADDRRTGWISGLSERDGEAHPTQGGLRIGKRLPERGPAEPIDERLEWDRDGQYFHYLTRWMHALDQAARASGQPLFNRWACELARAAHRGFCPPPRGTGGRMYWKVSIDLSRPLVASMGQHDPLDGFITCVQLDATGLAAEAADFAAMIAARALATDDPLGLGGLLVDAHRIDQLRRTGAMADAGDLRALLLAAAGSGLGRYLEQAERRAPAGQRLAFRELGLAIGLAALDRMVRAGPGGPEVERLARYQPLRTEIESFWLQAEHRRTDVWLEHADINDVMLATSLAPEGYLVLRPAQGGVP
jgi:hypothetical protein